MRPTRETLRFQRELERKPPAEILSWARDVWSGVREAPPGFNWLGLAENADTNARGPLALTWATIAVYVQERLAESSPSVEAADGRLESAQIVRARMIAEHGPVPGDHVRDPLRIRGWFDDSAPFGREETRRVASELRELGKTEAAWRQRRGERVALALLKGRLSAMRWYVDSGIVPADDELRAWLALFDELP